jgi:hypothetical protein
MAALSRRFPQDLRSKIQHYATIFVKASDGAAVGRTVNSLNEATKIALAFVLVPPPIQGIGNAGGVQMQLERQFGGVHQYAAQTPPCHRRHLRTARRVWRMVVLATQTPLTRVLNGPQPKRTCVIMASR